MTLDELKELIDSMRRFETDTADVEAKRAEAEMPKRLRETLSAFSNAPGGGVLILGVDEDSGFQVTGVKDVHRLQQEVGNLCGEMDPPVRAVIRPFEVQGKHVLVAEVPELPVGQKPCYYPGAGLTHGAFIRVADGNRKLTAYEVQMMLASRGQAREDEEAVPDATIGDLDRNLVRGLLTRLRRGEAGPFRELSNEESLRTLKVLVQHKGRFVPSLGGLLALGKYPQKFFPSLCVTLVVYPTPRVGEPGARGERFLDNRRIEGAIPRMLGPVLDGLRRNMKRRAVVRGLFREDLWEYPETALREALVNALAHRDLSAHSRGTPVQLQMFPDRLVIMNPGGLFGPVTVDRLGEEGVSSTRNQTVMKLLEDTTLPGEPRTVCENRGSGIGAMISSLRQAGMGLPKFDDYISTFQVTFPNATLLDPETLRWLERVNARELSDSQRMALAALRHGGVLTNATYRHLTSLDSRVVTRELGDLVRRRLIVQVGTRRWTTYQIPEDLVADPGPPTRERRRGDRREEITDLLARQGEMSASEIGKALGITDNAVVRWMRALIGQGLAERTTTSPRSPKTRYRRAKRATGQHRNKHVK